jgi:hypothetical protein
MLYTGHFLFMIYTGHFLFFMTPVHGDGWLVVSFYSVGTGFH